MMEIPCGMQEQFLEAKELIESSNDIKIYTHTDCDGICSGAILSIILDRLNKDYEIEFVNLDEIEDLDLDHKLTIFSDLGSGQGVDKNAKDDQKILILDHHPPLRVASTNALCISVAFSSSSAGISSITGAPPSGFHEYFFINNTSIKALKPGPVAIGYWMGTTLDPYASFNCSRILS